MDENLNAFILDFLGPTPYICDGLTIDGDMEAELRMVHSITLDIWFANGEFDGVLLIGLRLDIPRDGMELEMLSYFWVLVIDHHFVVAFVLCCWSIIDVDFGCDAREY
jgi:hypothetical protein